MNIIILGAGGLGRNLASTLSDDKHDIVVVDLKANNLKNIKEHLDVMTIQGNSSSIDILKRAGIENAQLLIAATGDDASNILACQIANMIKWLAPENKPIKKIIVAGASRMGINLARKLDKTGFDVRVIESDFDKCEEIIDKTKSDIKVVNGDPTNSFILNEAGIKECDVFIGVLGDDENNILSCVLAKKHGARKVVVTTKKSEYIKIVPDLDIIDCGFNSSLVAVNTVLRHLGTGGGKLSIDAVLHRVDAYVYEFEIEAGSELCDKKVQDCGILDYAVKFLLKKLSSK